MQRTLGRLAGTACLIFALMQTATAQELPQRGASMASVEQQFGAPVKKHAPVGNPPITRWDYQNYSVFFEGNTALHAVSHERSLVRPRTAEHSEAQEAHITKHGTVLALPPLEGVEEEASPRASANEAAPATASKDDQDGRFRFDPDTGRLVPSNQPETPKQEAEPTVEEEAQGSHHNTSQEDAEPQTEAATESTEEESSGGGFQMNW